MDAVVIFMRSPELSGMSGLPLI